MRIDACFDSHVHWAATGEFAQRLRLDDLRTAADVRNLNPEPHHHRGDWLLGYGFDSTAWDQPPHRDTLDQWRPNEAIVLTARDGHHRWLSTEALRRARLLNGPSKPGDGIDRDARGVPTGVVREKACDRVDQVLPQATAASIRRDLLAAMRSFNLAGFTHVRDMTCDEAQWQEAVKLDHAGVLTLAVEEYFWVRDSGDLPAVLATVRRARETPTENLRARGIKIFFDGTLGGEGALLSKGYGGGSHHGEALWTRPDLAHALTAAWGEGFEVAVHAIGDEAAARVIATADSVSKSGTRGRLHLEHAQVLRPETIRAMKQIDVRCHLQPVHWFEDRAWLAEKLQTLAPFAFPWRKLQEEGIAFSFGSDSPIEKPSVERTVRAVSEAALAGVPRLLGRAETYLKHPDPAWTPNSFTVFDDLSPREVIFRGQHLI